MLLPGSRERARYLYEQLQQGVLTPEQYAHIIEMDEAFVEQEPEAQRALSAAERFKEERKAHVLLAGTPERMEELHKQVEEGELTPEQLMHIAKMDAMHLDLEGETLKDVSPDRRITSAAIFHDAAAVVKDRSEQARLARFHHEDDPRPMHAIVQGFGKRSTKEIQEHFALHDGSFGALRALLAAEPAALLIILRDFVRTAQRGSVKAQLLPLAGQIEMTGLEEQEEEANWFNKRSSQLQEIDVQVQRLRQQLAEMEEAEAAESGSVGSSAEFESSDEVEYGSPRSVASFATAAELSDEEEQSEALKDRARTLRAERREEEMRRLRSLGLHTVLHASQGDASARSLRREIERERLEEALLRERAFE